MTFTHSLDMPTLQFVSPCAMQFYRVQDEADCFQVTLHPGMVIISWTFYL
jgi:hypothetical protein